VPIDSVLALGDAAVTRTSGSGADLPVPTPAVTANRPAPKPLARAITSKERQAALRSMQTIYIDAENAKNVGSDT